MLSLFRKKPITTDALMVATLVDWEEKLLVKNLEKQLKKAIKKNLDVSSVSTNRINTFLVISVDLVVFPSVNDRRGAELQIKKMLEKYSESLNSKYRKELAYNGDSNIYLDAFGEHGLNLKESNYNRSHVLLDKVETQIETIISTASLIVWDAEGWKNDRIILPELVATIDSISDLDGSKFPEIADLLDELIIANFGTYFLPFAGEILKYGISDLKSLQELLDSSPVYGSLDKNTERCLRNFIGSISGLQESLKLLYRIVDKLTSVHEDIQEDLFRYPCHALHDWLSSLQEIDGQLLMQLIDELDQRIAYVKPKLRMLLKSRGGSKNDISQLFTNMINIKSVAGALIHYSSQFSDIPSFTTMPEGIAFELVENEVYEKQNEDALLEITKVFKMYRRGGSTVYALRGMDFAVNEGDFVVIQGPSGSGKTTLLNMLAGLDSPDRGAVYFRDIDINSLRDTKRAKLRRENFSFIFQNYALIPHLNAFENTRLPIDMAGLSRKLVEEIQGLLDDVGIGEYADHKPAYLSGGQMQRLGIARALASQPSIIFADEPTGDLDAKTGTKIMNLLKKYHDETGVTIILVSHNPEIYKYGTRTIQIKDGQIMK